MPYQSAIDQLVQDMEKQIISLYRIPAHTFPGAPVYDTSVEKAPTLPELTDGLDKLIADSDNGKGFRYHARLPRSGAEMVVSRYKDGVYGPMTSLGFGESRDVVEYTDDKGHVTRYDANSPFLHKLPASAYENPGSIDTTGLDRKQARDRAEYEAQKAQLETELRNALSNRAPVVLAGDKEESTVDIGPLPNDNLRIGDADRQRYFDHLGDMYAGGYLSREEFDERSTKVQDAHTAPELEKLVADLPAMGSNRERAVTEFKPDSDIWMKTETTSSLKPAVYALMGVATTLMILLTLILALVL